MYVLGGKLPGDTLPQMLDFQQGQPADPAAGIRRGDSRINPYAVPSCDGLGARRSNVRSAAATHMIPATTNASW